MTRFQKRLSFTLSIPTYILALLLLSIYVDSPLLIITLPITALGYGLWILSDEFFKGKQ